jgi:4-amino-4-deoxy-L-arabinose transferase-like glycosyltransferase
LLPDSSPDASGIMPAVNRPTPALVTQRAARRMPRLALLLLCAAYVLPGTLGRDPWRHADITAFGYMLSMAEGRSAWLSPSLGGIAAEAALLPYWLGAAFIKLLSPLLDPAIAARLPFAALLGLTLALTWYAAYHLARTEAAQPVTFAFGGQADPIDYARAVADAAVLALIASLGLLQLGHETTPELAQLFAVSLTMWAMAAAPYRVWRARLGIVISLALLAGSGAPFVALAAGAASTVVCLRSNYAQVRRLAPWVALATVLAIVLAMRLNIWSWRLAMRPEAPRLASIARQWLWFLWPSWLLALWTLWRWRQHLQHRHVSVPLVTAAVALLWSLAMRGSDRAFAARVAGHGGAGGLRVAHAEPQHDRRHRLVLDDPVHAERRRAVGHLCVGADRRAGQAGGQHRALGARLRRRVLLVGTAAGAGRQRRLAVAAALAHRPTP